MPKRLTGVLVLVLAALTGVIAWQVLREREPVYQGKPLSFWLHQYRGPGDAEDGPAATAIRHIGTNAIPFCVRRIAAPESPLKRKLLSLLSQRWAARLHLRTTYAERFKGAYGLYALDFTQSKAAIPALIGLLNDKDPEVRYVAMYTLNSIYPAAGGEVVTAALSSLQDTDNRVQQLAMDLLGNLHQEPQRVVPVLIHFLNTNQPVPVVSAMRDEAIWSLRQFRAQAEPAVPQLLRLLNDSSFNTRIAVTNALLWIDPEAATKAGVK